MINRENGFTLTELVVGLFIGAVIILIIGVISSTSIGSYEKLRKEAEVYNDVYYGLNLIKRLVRNTPSNQAMNVTSGKLTIGNFTFMKDNNSFNYTVGTNTNTIIGNVTGLVFLPVNSTDNRFINITLKGEKDKVSFNLTTEVMRRN